MQNLWQISSDSYGPPYCREIKLATNEMDSSKPSNLMSLLTKAFSLNKFEKSLPRTLPTSYREGRLVQTHRAKILTQKWVFHDFKTAHSLSSLINIAALVLEKAQRYFINSIHVYVPLLN